MNTLNIRKKHLKLDALLLVYPQTILNIQIYKTFPSLIIMLCTLLLPFSISTMAKP